MNISRETYGKGRVIDSLYNEVVLLEKQYADFIEQESLTEEVATLKAAIEEYLQGSPEAASYLREHGASILQDIKDKLEAATAEQMRIIEESPAQNLSTGKEAHKASRATALAIDVEEKFETALDEELS
ncbi:MAG: hypothetical protein ACN2B6_10780 [Rickettsiales bacterium]